MNILTFDIEDWYNCDFISTDLNWDKYEVRIYEGVDRILDELEFHKLKATFFCLGWIAEKHPGVIRKIHSQGHHIGCHSYQHELSFRFDRNGFRDDTEKSKKLIEDIIGERIDAFRAPGFSVTVQNLWAFEVLAELGFDYDCSVFPAKHDYGGLSNYGRSEPAILVLADGRRLKEFPVNFMRISGINIVFSGGGFFRFFPYRLIKHWTSVSSYMMTYFHTRDFDPDQPRIRSLPPIRRFKSYAGLSGSFVKFQKLLRDFEFVSVREADRLIDWEKARVIESDKLIRV